jgi:hypothetical protein
LGVERADRYHEFCRFLSSIATDNGELGVGNTLFIKSWLVLRREHSPSTMAPAAEKSTSSKREETSKLEEKVAEPLTSLSVPPKEVTTKTARRAERAERAAEALAWKVRATREIQHQPVAVLENGMSKSPLYSDRNGYTYSLTHFMPRSSIFNVSLPSDQQVSECLRTDRRQVHEMVFDGGIVENC